MIGTVASIMASTIINGAVADMSRAFTLGHERAQWLSAGFLVAFALIGVIASCAIIAAWRMSRSQQQPLDTP